MGADALPRSSDGLFGCRCIQSNACLTAAVVTAAANLQENTSTQRSNSFMQFRLAVRQAKRSHGKAPVGDTAAEDEFVEAEPSGSNGAAIAPSNTRDHHALLLINPHTSFFFRSELQMTSDEGLNAYGAATWGQFFIYQGFNARTGWMHTSSGVDAVDEYLETVTQKGNAFFYKYGSNNEKPFIAGQVTVKYKTDRGRNKRTINPTARRWS